MSRHRSIDLDIAFEDTLEKALADLVENRSVCVTVLDQGGHGSWPIVRIEGHAEHVDAIEKRYNGEDG